jgi:hypothetical protein
LNVAQLIGQALGAKAKISGDELMTIGNLGLTKDF